MNCNSAEQMPSSGSETNCPQIGYIDGDTRLVRGAVPMYYQQLLSSAPAVILNIRQAPLFKLFFSNDNVHYLQKQIVYALEKITGERFQIPANNEFGQSMETIAESNIGLSEEISFLPWLNYTFVKHEVAVQFASYRQAVSYHKLILENDRPKWLPYGVNDLQTKGEVTISHSSYNLTHPWQQRRNEYLLLTEGLQYCPLDKQYQRIDHYLKPTLPNYNHYNQTIVLNENNPINSCCK